MVIMSYFSNLKRFSGKLQSHTLTDEDLNLLQNEKYTRECIPFAFGFVIKIGSDKKPDESFKQCINRMKNLDSKSQAKLQEDDFALKLENKNIDDLDVSFLYSLTSIICNVPPWAKGGKWKSTQDTGSLEHVLREAKELRNKHVHEPNTSKSSELHNQMKTSLEAVILTAFKIFSANKDQSIVTSMYDETNKAIRELDQKFVAIALQCFRGTYMTSYIKERVKRKGRQEMTKIWEDSFSHFVLPLSCNVKCKRNQVFSEITFSYRDKQVAGRIDYFSCYDFFRHGESRFKLIEGTPGSGKTMFLKFIVDSWLTVTNDSLHQDLDRFEIIILIECRTCRRWNLAHLLKEKLSETLEFLPDDGVTDAANQLEILFLVDGYDEVNDQSKLLIWDVIDMSKNHSNWFFVLSARPEACENFTRELTRRGILLYDTIRMEPLSSISKMIKFLKKYDEDENSLSFQAVENKLKEVPDTVLTILGQPILLAMAYILFKKELNFIQELTNERIVFAKILQICEEDLSNKIEEDGCFDPQDVANELMDKIGILSLELHLSGDYFLRNDKYRAFIKKCKREIKERIQYDKALSCIFSKEQDSYNFPHTSIQEYLAAKHIFQKIVRNHKIAIQSESTSGLFSWLSWGFNIFLPQSKRSNKIKTEICGCTEIKSEGWGRYKILICCALTLSPLLKIFKLFLL